MKLYFILFFVISVMPMVAMQGGKSSIEIKSDWESGKFPQYVKWIRHDQNGMIVIIERSNVHTSTGKRYDANSAVTQLTPQEVRKYLKEIHSPKLKVNPRDI